MKYLYIFTFSLLFNFAIAQNVQFGYTVEATSATTRVLTFTATNTGAAETIQAGTWRVYYNSTKTAFDVGDATPLGADGGTPLYTFTNVAGTNTAAPGADNYIDLNGLTFGTALNIPDANPVTIFTITMENVSADPDPMNDVYFVNTAEDPVVAYSGSGGSGNPINVSGPQSQSLPIDLKSFTATKNERSVQLDWETSSETNGSHFDVERSQDLETWELIGTVDAVGESSTLQTYDFLDDKLPLNARNNHKTFYYRLNMVDNDESAEYSEVRSVRFDLDGEGDFLVYPNPSVNEVYVNLSSVTPETGPATLNIIDMNGKLVRKVPLMSNDDIQVDVSNMISGVYYFMAQQGENTFTQKVIIVD